MKHFNLVRTLLIGVISLTTTTAFAQLSGNYTLDPAANATATNYKNWASAVGDLINGSRTDGGPAQGPGVSAAVHFTVAAATYNEKVQITAINGASATNTITFEGVNDTNVVLTQASTIAYDYTLFLNGADYIRIENMTIQNTGASYGYAVQLMNQADNNQFKHLFIKAPKMATSNYQVAFITGQYYTSYSNAANNTTIDSCEITGGRYSVVLNGQSGLYGQNNHILNSTVTDFYFCGIWMYYQLKAKVDHCHVYGPANGYVSSYGMYLYYVDEPEVTNSRIQETGTYAIRLYYSNFTSLGRGKIYNNFLGGDFQTASSGYALYMYNCQRMDVWHNSMLLDAPNGGYCFYLNGSSSTDNEILNNSIAYNEQGANGYAFYLGNMNYLKDMDYNNYWSTGSNLCYWGSVPFADLPSLLQFWPNFNLKSKEQWPNYFSSTNLHTFGAPLANWAKDITSMTKDIDDETRPFSPDTIKDVGADEFVLAPFDLDILSVISPVVLGIGNNTVTVDMLNNGNNSLNGMNIIMQYSTNGGSTWAVTDTFVPSNLASTGSTEQFSFSTPWNVTVDGTYNLCVRINPQVSGDPDNEDKICQSVCTGMSGTYTINKAQPTSGTNYNSFVDAANALSVCGVAGPVTINVAPGTYNETFTISAIPGSDSNNVVTFQGYSCDSTVIQYSFSQTNYGIVNLDGADYVTFRNLAVEATGNYGYCFWLKNQADHNTIDSCCIFPSTQVLNSYNIGVLISNNNYYTYQNSGNYNTISNSTIEGGYYGARLNGTSTTVHCEGNKFINCDVSNFYYYGLFVYYQEAYEIIGNHVYGGTITSPNSYGMYSYYATGDIKIQSNDFDNLGRMGMYLLYTNSQGGGFTPQITNNMIGAGWKYTNGVYGIYFNGMNGAEIYHNSINLDGYSGYAMYMTGSSSQNKIKNNIFASQAQSNGGGYAMYVSSTNAVTDIDYNCYYTPGGNWVYFGGTAYATLTALQTAFPSWNQNSLDFFPGYKSSTDLHIFCSILDDAGDSLGVQMDFDNMPRSLPKPDIGADEFTSASVTVDLGPDTTACGDLLLEVDTLVWAQHIWTGGKKLYNHLVDSTDTYDVIAIDSNNCVAFDTINVTIHAQPVKPWQQDTMDLCPGDTLSAQNPNHAYLWNTTDTIQEIQPPSAGFYDVTITSPFNCVEKDTVFITLLGQPSTILGPDTTFCLGSSYTLDAGNSIPGQTWSWSNGAVSQVVLVSAPGAYWVTVTSPNGCYATDTMNINALLPPVVNLGPDGYQCGPFTLDAQNSGSQFVWNNNTTGQTLSSNQTGQYYVTVTNQAGCTDSDTINITMATPPNVNLGPDLVVCNGSTSTLDAQNAGSNYFWSTGASTQTITVSQAGLYIVQVTDPVTKCVGFDSVNVTASPLAVFLGPDSPICPNETVVLDAGNPGSTYNWSTSAATQTVSVTQPGTYSVTVQDQLGCQATDQITLTLGPAITSTFSATQNTPLFQPVQFTDGSNPAAVSWFWDFGDGSTSTQQNPNHIYLAMGTFTVCLTASNGTCEDVFCDQVTIAAPIAIDPGQLADGVTIYPNPNNGRFEVAFDLTNATDIEMSVMNLTGQTIYSRALNNVAVRTEAIDITGQAAGIYLLRIRTSENNEVFHKIMVE